MRWARLQSGRSRLRGLAACAVVVLGIAAGGCGDESEAANRDATVGVGQARVGSVASLAQCTDWNEGTDAERLVTIGDIRAQVNQAGADGPTPDLSDAAATALFDRFCANDYAQGFRLYKLYLRAASFGGLRP
jgi:hypothetical protein